jgi:hypothetical protein
MRLPMRHHEIGRRVEAVDQGPGLVVDREAEGPGHPLHAAQTQPGGRGVDQEPESLLVVDGFQKAEMAGGVVVALEMRLVDLGRNAPDGLAVEEHHPIAASMPARNGFFFAFKWSSRSMVSGWTQVGSPA